MAPPTATALALLLASLLHAAAALVPLIPTQGTTGFAVPAHAVSAFLDASDVRPHGWRGRRRVAYSFASPVSVAASASASASGDDGPPGGLPAPMGDLVRPESLPLPPLSSAYDMNLPAGLRGEAVRSALRSERGICLDLTAPSDKYAKNVNVGLVKVEGKGTLDFLDGKFTNSFGTAGGQHFSDRQKGRLTEACLLTPRGRTIDKILVATVAGEGAGAAKESSCDVPREVEAFLLTSPGHSGSALFDRLDPFVFPMDGVKLTDMCPEGAACTRVFTLAAANLSNVENMIRKFVLPNLEGVVQAGQSFQFPGKGECIRLEGRTTASGSNLEVMVLPATFLPHCVCVGYTIVFTETGTSAGTASVADGIWDTLTAADNNDEGPIEIGPLEWDTLRIEGGWPAYGTEMTGDSGGDSDDGDSTNDAGGGTCRVGVGAKASPLELRLESSVDEGKGCYLGQEAVAALLKNKRGLPRTLYSVVFKDDDNAFEHLQGRTDDDYGELQGSNDDDIIDLAAVLLAQGSATSNDMAESTARLPEPGDELYVLGSSITIRAGTITSIAENGATGDPTTIGLALVRRADTILKKMDEMGLELGGGDWSADDQDYNNESVGGVIAPPPVEPLDGLEVIIKGTNTFGTIRALPESRYARQGRNMFDQEVASFRGGDSVGSVMGYVPTSSRQGKEDIESEPDRVDNDASTSSETGTIPSGWESSDTDESLVEDEELRRATDEATKAAAEAEAAAAESKRKAEKMEMLKKRAEEAKARRRSKKAQSKEGGGQ